jgi:hypothetical protein
MSPDVRENDDRQHEEDPEYGGLPRKAAAHFSERKSIST